MARFLPLYNRIGVCNGRLGPLLGIGTPPRFLPPSQGKGDPEGSVPVHGIDGYEETDLPGCGPRYKGGNRGVVGNDVGSGGIPWMGRGYGGGFGMCIFIYIK